MGPNGIAGYIAGWFGAVPAGLFLPLATDGNNQIVVNEAARDKAAEAAAIKWLDTAIAICLAESNGNPNAKNASGASGLWQIMMPLHEDLVKLSVIAVNTQLGTSQKLDVFDPRVNTHVASRLYESKGWQPWQTYTNGDYKKYQGHGQKAWEFLNSPDMRNQQWQKYRANLYADSGYAEIGALAGSVGGKWNPYNIIMTFLKDSGITVGIFLVALLAVILGIVVLAKSIPIATVTKISE